MPETPVTSLSTDKMSTRTLILLGLAATLVINVASKPTVTKEWWKNTFIYQVYPRSFMDSDGDGVGDLNGIINKLHHFVDLNVSSICLSPIYSNSMVNLSYSAINFTDIDPILGTVSDFTNLTAQAKALGLKIILDFVPNHTSNLHPWFLNSVKKIKPYDDYYVWRDGLLVNGTSEPPNNWVSLVGGSAWQFHPERAQYYLHQFSASQPDLNYESLPLNQELDAILGTWMDRGVDGFKFDAVNYLCEDPEFLDEPRIVSSNLPSSNYASLDHIYTTDQSGTYKIVATWRKYIDDHGKKKIKGGDPKIILTQADTSLENVNLYYSAGANIPVNFLFMTGLNNHSRTTDFKQKIDAWMNSMPKGLNWVLGNQDESRVATRFGPRRVDQFSMLAAVLPGTGILYYGDDIGMTDRLTTWSSSIDSVDCSFGIKKCFVKSQNPQRTPYQWDNTTNSGFSRANRTWLAVNSNYRTVNLAVQKSQRVSHFVLLKKLIGLKMMPVMETATTEVILVKENVLGLVRRFVDSPPVVLLINFSDSTEIIDARTWMNIPEELTVFAASVGYNIPWGIRMDTTEINLPGDASVILADL